VPTLTARATDAAGDTLTDLLVSFRSSDTTVASFRRGELNGLIWPWRPGVASFYVSASVFGVTKADTVPYRIGLPSMAVISIDTAGGFSPSEYRVGVGAAIAWGRNPTTTQPMEVTFADAALPDVAAATTPPWSSLESSYYPGVPIVPLYCSVGWDCGAGNFVLSDQNQGFAIRVLRAPGTYEYRSATYGTAGRITVVAEP